MQSKWGLLRYTSLCRRDVGGLHVSDSEVGQRIRDELEETRRQSHARSGWLSAADGAAPSRNPAGIVGKLERALGGGSLWAHGAVPREFHPKVSRGCGRLPEGVGAWLTMGRRRRRIRLIY